jgi:hypothetical protein
MVQNYAELDTYASLSGTKLSAPEGEKLAAYAGTYGQFYCRHAGGREFESRRPRHFSPDNP